MTKYSSAQQAATGKGLTLLQDQKISDVSRGNFEREWNELSAFCRTFRLALTTSTTADIAISRYLDSLFLDGYNHDKGEKAIAAARHFRPDLPLGDSRSMPRTYAAVRGFRRLAPGHTRPPLPRPALFAAVGLAGATGRLELALALALSWDCCLRLPSDLVRLTGASLIPPTNASRAWGLLMYPDEQGVRSKTGNFDEGVVLSRVMSAAAGEALARLQALRAPTELLWTFNAGQFQRAF